MFNKDTHSLVLRACKEDMSSFNGFIWPTSGVVECPDWDPVPKCGNGLHGWLYGHGNGKVSDYWSENDKWLVVSVETSSIIELDGKVKFQKGDVVFCGDRESATDFLMKHEPRSLLHPVIGAVITVGDRQTATTSYKGTSIVGNNSTAISGDYGTSTSENFSTAISGDYGTSTSGYHGKSISNNDGISTSSEYGTSISGEGGKSISSLSGMSISSNDGTSISSERGTATSGNRGYAESGDYGTSITGVRGISITGNHGTCISGYYGKCKAGEKSVISIYYYENNRVKLKTGYIGEDGLEPNTFYCLDVNFNFVKCE